MFHYKCLGYGYKQKRICKLCPLCYNPGEIENIITVEKPKFQLKII